MVVSKIILREAGDKADAPQRSGKCMYRRPGFSPAVARFLREQLLAGLRCLCVTKGAERGAVHETTRLRPVI